MQDDKHEPTVRDVLEGKQRGDPVLSRLHDKFEREMSDELRRLDKIRADADAQVQGILATQAEQVRLAAQARAQMEADRIAREQATLEGIHAIRDAAVAAAAASDAREAASAEREARLVRMTEVLVRVTWGLAILAGLTLAATIAAIVLAA